MNLDHGRHPRRTTDSGTIFRRAGVPIRPGQSANARAQHAAVARMDDAQRITGRTADELDAIQRDLRESFYAREERRAA